MTDHRIPAPGPDTRIRAAGHGFAVTFGHDGQIWTCPRCGLVVAPNDPLLEPCTERENG